MHHARRLKEQKTKSEHLLYAFHAPEIECINKFKARQPYKFGVEASIALTAEKGLIVSPRLFSGNPYYGDTLTEQLTASACSATEVQHA